MPSKRKKAEIDSSADDEDVDGDGVQSASSKRKTRVSLKTATIAGLALLVLGGGGAAAYFFFAPNSPNQASVLVKPAIFVDVPEVLVNLANPGGERTQYLKVKIVLEMPDQALAQQIQPFMPRVMDTFQIYLRELRPTDLDGSAGLYRLKEELTRRVNASIAPGRVNAVLFKEVIVQ
jgi:flagellar FliL protein